MAHDMLAIPRTGHRHAADLGMDANVVAPARREAFSWSGPSDRAPAGTQAALLG